MNAKVHAEIVRTGGRIRTAITRRRVKSGQNIS